MIIKQKFDELIEFTCIVCSKKFSYLIGDTTNLTKHLHTHEILRIWLINPAAPKLGKKNPAKFKYRRRV